MMQSQVAIRGSRNMTAVVTLTAIRLISHKDSLRVLCLAFCKNDRSYSCASHTDKIVDAAIHILTYGETGLESYGNCPGRHH